MAEAYKQLHQEKLEADSLRVLRLNYPQHPYLSGDWPGSRSLWRKLFPGGENKRWENSENAAVPPPSMSQSAIAALSSSPN